MNTLRIALLQLSPFGYDQEKNLQKAEGSCRNAKEKGADIAVLPEMWNTGYAGYEKGNADAYKTWKEQAIATDGPFVSHFQALARELDMAIVVTYLQSWHGYPKNSATLIDRHGKALGTFSKVHTCAFGYVEATLTPGEDFYVFDLDTALGVVKTGMMICYDFEFPESGRILMLKGAEVILNPVACELNDKRHGQLQARARENAMCVASVNYAKPNHDGHSVAFDAEGNKVAEGTGEEAMVIAGFELDKLREYRKKTIWGNAFRRPKIYSLLTSTKVQEPFLRKNGLGEPFDRR